MISIIIDERVADNNPELLEQWSKFEEMFNSLDPNDPLVPGFKLRLTQTSKPDDAEDISAEFNSLRMFVKPSAVPEPVIECNQYGRTVIEFAGSFIIPSPTEVTPYADIYRLQTSITITGVLPSTYVMKVSSAIPFVTQGFDNFDNFLNVISGVSTIIAQNSDYNPATPDHFLAQSRVVFKQEMSRRRDSLEFILRPEYIGSTISINVVGVKSNGGTVPYFSAVSPEITAYYLENVIFSGYYDTCIPN